MCFEKVSVSNSENCYFAALASPSYWSQGMSFFLFCFVFVLPGVEQDGMGQRNRDGTSLMEISCQHSVVVTQIESWGLLY